MRTDRAQTVAGSRHTFRGARCASHSIQRPTSTQRGPGRGLQSSRAVSADKARSTRGAAPLQPRESRSRTGTLGAAAVPRENAHEGRPETIKTGPTLQRGHAFYLPGRGSSGGSTARSAEEVRASSAVRSGRARLGPSERRRRGAEGRGRGGKRSAASLHRSAAPCVWPTPVPPPLFAPPLAGTAPSFAPPHHPGGALTSRSAPCAISPHPSADCSAHIDHHAFSTPRPRCCAPPTHTVHPSLQVVCHR